ncbi:flagellar basal-body rod protein FlgG [Hansschlegelia beijingensis]|uniref:Flagellar basal-body rod protein FlgG n=1 Tax=Hansschlegelia beijingensis TaxID=1133344 RepID=A0A7W6GFQ6_9HYPH|nr:flagellar basal-body rod protein FlgG [Hansschlegelia beijingensis]MBB3973535.1 flagellar basal-body rod protein FlgG [Hansschlegelia beijingensis]
MRALYTASTGMAAQEMNVEIISNNIANMRTSGFKRQRAEFQDLLYESLRRVGSSSSDTGTVLPTGVDIGSGVKLVATPRVMSQGSVAATEKPYDIAIRGEGFFQVNLPDGTTAYTRDGSFELDPNGQLVTADGYVVAPGITVPANALSVAISATGEVEATIQGQTATQNLGQLQLARFMNKSGLEAKGDNLFLETPASGTPLVDIPGAEGFGSVLQSYLEQSNVNAVTEISDLIAAQRAYEMNSKVVSSADQMLQASAAMMR